MCCPSICAFMCTPHSSEVLILSYWLIPLPILEVFHFWLHMSSQSESWVLLLLQVDIIYSFTWLLILLIIFYLCFSPLQRIWSASFFFFLLLISQKLAWYNKDDVIMNIVHYLNNILNIFFIATVIQKGNKNQNILLWHNNNVLYICQACHCHL